MKPPVAAALLLSAALLRAPAPPATHFINGQWIDGARFVAADFYAEDGVLTQTPRDPDDAVTVDLRWQQGSHMGAIPPAAFSGK